jgi:hypothetical protein
VLTLAAIAGLVGFVALGSGLGVVAARWEIRSWHFTRRNEPLVGDVLSGFGGGFTGGLAAFLLSIIMLTALEGYNSAQDSADAEAVAYSAAFQTSAAFAEPGRTEVQRDLVCLMRSVTTDSWSASTAEEAVGDTNTAAWQTRTLASINAIKATSTAQEEAIKDARAYVIEAASQEQFRLFRSDRDTHFMLWLLVGISLAGFSFLVVQGMLPSRVHAASLVITITLVTAVAIGVASAFADPYDDEGGIYLQPTSLEAVMTRMQSEFPGPVWEPCERLAGGVPSISPQ